MPELNKGQSKRVCGENKHEANKGGDLKLVQFEMLRHEIIHYFEEYGRIERFALASSAAVYSWIFTRPSDIQAEEIFQYSYLLPPALILISMCKAFAMLSGAIKIGRFLKEKYANEFDSPLNSWEQRLAIERASRKDILFLMGWIGSIGIWVITLFASTIVAINALITS